MTNKDHNSVKEIEVHEDDRPSEDPEDNIEEEDRIILYVVEETVGLIRFQKLLHGRDGDCEDTEEDGLQLCIAGREGEVRQNDKELETELGGRLSHTLNEFELQKGTPEISIVWEDASESHDKAK